MDVLETLKYDQMASLCQDNNKQESIKNNLNSVKFKWPGFQLFVCSF